LLVFFFQAEDGIRDRNVTGVQTCALPILTSLFSVVLHNLWSLSIAVTKLHLCTNSRVKCPFPEPISKILSCSFKLIFVIILYTLRFEVIKFCLSFLFFFFFFTLFKSLYLNFCYFYYYIISFFFFCINTYIFLSI